MAHLALYREFRPKTFDDVIGQEQVVTTLENQIKTGKISHAYLFCGTRGTGKTTCAKIMARAVNCLSPKNGSPCGECEICKKIQANGNLDIVEIDAASNNRVDEIRDLREKVSYLPSVGKYKVYIIDEVHMLTDSAFNALLKTLEEPPEHIVFILATTEPEKLPATILSRCMRFDFKLVGENDLIALLKKIFEKTSVTYDAKSLEMIAKAGKGSVRDTLSVAEMCKAFCNDNIVYDKVEKCLGLTDALTLSKIANAIAKKDGGAIITMIDNLYEQGKNLVTLIADLCDYFKSVLTYKLTKEYDLNVPKSIEEGYIETANLCDEKYLLNCLQILCEGMTQVKYSVNDKVFTITLLLRMFYNDNLEIEQIKQKVSELEKRLESGNFIEKKTENRLAASGSKQETMAVISNSKEPSTESINEAKEIFGKFIGYTRNNGEMFLFSALNDVKDVSIKNDELVFVCSTKESKEVIDSHKQFIIKFLEENCNLKSFCSIMYVDKQKMKEEKLSEMLDGKLIIK